MARKVGRDNKPEEMPTSLVGCDDKDASAELPEWDSHPSIIKETRLRPDIVIHSASTQQLIMVELTVPYENKMEEAHIYKREKYMKLIKELENVGYKAVVMPVEVGAREFIGSSVYDFLTELSICGDKKVTLQILAEIAKNSLAGPGARETRGSFITIARPVSSL